MLNSEKANSNRLEFAGIDFTSISTTWVYKLNKENLTYELARRNVITTRIVTELRTRFLKYLKGKFMQDDFILESSEINFIPDNR